MSALLKVKCKEKYSPNDNLKKKKQKKKNTCLSDAALLKI